MRVDPGHGVSRDNGTHDVASNLAAESHGVAALSFTENHDVPLLRQNCQAARNRCWPKRSAMSAFALLKVTISATVLILVLVAPVFQVEVEIALQFVEEDDGRRCRLPLVLFTRWTQSRPSRRLIPLHTMRFSASA